MTPALLILRDLARRHAAAVLALAMVAAFLARGLGPAAHALAAHHGPSHALTAGGTNVPCEHSCHGDHAGDDHDAPRTPDTPTPPDGEPRDDHPGSACPTCVTLLAVTTTASGDGLIEPVALGASLFAGIVAAEPVDPLTHDAGRAHARGPPGTA